MLTLRLDKINPTRSEFYEADVITMHSDNSKGVVPLSTHTEKGVVEHFIGPLPGQATTAYIMNADGKTIEVIRAPKDG